jgi:hypothetical protein
MAGVASIFTQKSHSAPGRAHNALILNDCWGAGGIFDSDRPLQSPAIAGQREPSQSRPILGEVFIEVGSQWL